MGGIPRILAVQEGVLGAWRPNAVSPGNLADEERPPTHSVILVSQTGQQTYDDSERHYTYPACYNAALAPLMAGEPTVVILYESRRAGSGRGLQAYIGWTVVTRPPEPAGQGLWVLTHDSPVVPLPRPVKQEESGVVMEAWLGAFPLRERGVRQNGLSIRPVTEADATRIFAAAGLLGLTPSAAWTASDGEDAERRRVLVERAVRGDGLAGPGGPEWGAAGRRAPAERGVGRSGSRA